MPGKAEKSQFNYVATALVEFRSVGLTAISGGYVECSGGLSHRNSLLIHNSGTSTMYVGATGAAIVDCIPIPTGEKLGIDASEDLRFYAQGAGAVINFALMELN